MGERMKKRIVFDASNEVCNELTQTAEQLHLSKVGTIKLAVSLLADLAEELSKGSKLVLKGENDEIREIWLPQLRPHKKD